MSEANRDGGPAARAARAVACGLLTLALATSAPPASARIFQTKPSPSSNWVQGLPITIGSGFEFDTDKEKSEYGFPMLFEYSFTETLKLVVEPSFVYIESKAKDVSTVRGFSDLETSLEYEFLRERRYRPALSLEGLIKWPTAQHADIGAPGRDYALGLILSKDLVFVDVDLNTLYTFVGDPEQQNTLELSLAGDWHLNRFIDLEAEVVRTLGTGGVRGVPGTLGGLGGASGGADDTQGAFGVAQHITRYLKLEEGVVVRSDLGTQIVFGWEYSFSGD